MSEEVFAVFNTAMMCVAIVAVLTSFVARGGLPVIDQAVAVAALAAAAVRLVTESLADELRSILVRVAAAVPAFVLLYVGASAPGISWRPSLLVWGLSLGASIPILRGHRAPESLSWCWVAWSTAVALMLLGTTIELIFGYGAPSGQMGTATLPPGAGAILGLCSLPALCGTFAPALSAARRELRQPPDVDLDRRDWWCILAGLLLFLVVGRVVGDAVGAPIAGAAAALVLGILLAVAWDLAAKRGRVRWSSGPLGPAMILFAITAGAIQFHLALTGRMPAVSFAEVVGWEAGAVWLIGRWRQSARVAG